MKKFINLSLGLSLVPFFALSSVNAEEVQDVENIIVTESRIPTIVSESLSAISVITREDIERYQASDLYDLMARLPGVSMLRNGARGSATSLSIRGNQGDHSLFLVDGVRIGSATLGSATLGLINTNSIERIEVVSGPKSNLYGADAMGGVVNIITRKPEDALMLKTSLGSNATKETTVSVAKNNDNHSFSAILNTFETDGIDSTYDTSSLNGDKDGHTNDGLALSYKYDDGNKTSWSLSYSGNDTTTDFDQNCNQSVWGNPVIDCDIYNSAKIASLSSSLEIKVSDVWQSNLQLGESIDEMEVFARNNVVLSDIGDDGVYNTKKTDATWFNVLSLENKGTLSLGLDYQKDEIDTSKNYAVNSRDNKAAFFQYKFKSDGADVSFGARRDDNEQFGAHTTASIMAGQDVSDNARLNFSYGEGFKPPSFNDLYWPDSGNPDFVPEQSKNIELGVKANFGNSSTNIAVFNNHLENLIQYNLDAGVTDQTAKAEITGLELSLETELAGWLFGLSGTVLKPEDKTTGKLLRRRAERSASLDGDYSFGNYGLGFTVYSQSHTFDNAANTIRFGGYTTLALRANFDLSDNWKVKVNANNLTDKEYITARGFLLVPEYRSMGRELLFTVAYTPSF